MVTRILALSALTLLLVFGGLAARGLATGATASPSADEGSPTGTVTATPTATGTAIAPTETGTPVPEATETPAPPPETPAPTDLPATETPAEEPSPTPEAPTTTPEPTNTSEPETSTANVDGAEDDEGILFQDSFETGDLRLWTSQSGMGVQQQEVASGSWAARATTPGGASALARLTLPNAQSQIYVQIRFKVVGQGTNEATLIHLRNAESRLVLSAFVTPGGRIAIRSEVGSLTLGSGAFIERNRWHELQVGLTIENGSGLSSVFLDGVEIPRLGASIRTGDNPIARVELGERSFRRVLDVAFDDVTISTDPLPSLQQPVEPTPTPLPSSLEFVPVADAQVGEDAVDTNNGRSTNLRADGGGDDAIESYLAFDVTGVTGPVTNATLRVYATSGSRDGPGVSTGDSSWSELEITWRNRPERTSGALDDAGRVASGSWIELDVTGAVTGDGLVTFVLHTDNSDGLNMSSREGANSPVLVLAFGTDEPPPPPPPATETPAPTDTVDDPATATPTEPAATELPTETATTAATEESTGTAEPTNTEIATRTPSATVAPTRTSTPRPTATATQPPGETGVLLAAGDISSCGNDNDSRTGALVGGLAGEILVLGDLAYEDGSARQFAECYDPAWGGVKDRTHPVPGNHEYGTGGARGYFDYFGSAAGEPGKGYYSFNVGEWHIVALNSNCDEIGGCGAGSAQEQWLRDDLAANPTRCTLAYWHHPMYSTGLHGSHVSRMRALWQALYDYGAEIVLSGHDHHYERFAPQNAASRLDTAAGIRQFVVGTGGRSLYDLETLIPNSEIRSNSTYGVLRLILRPAGYDWEFVPVSGGRFSDSGSGGCHGPQPVVASATDDHNATDDLALAGPGSQTLAAVLPAPPSSRSRAMRPRRTRRSPNGEISRRRGARPLPQAGSAIAEREGARLSPTRPQTGHSN